MVVETAQMLCNVHHRDAATKSTIAIPYKYSRSGHAKLGPMIWLGESLANYRWAVALGMALAREVSSSRACARAMLRSIEWLTRRNVLWVAKYTARFGGKVHKSQAVIEWLGAHEPPSLEDVGMTPPRCAMPDEYKIDGDPLSSYRRYYIYDKHRFAVWPDGMEPAWFTEGVEELKRTGEFGRVEIAYPTKQQAKRLMQARKPAPKRAKPEPVAVKRETRKTRRGEGRALRMR